MYVSDCRMIILGHNKNITGSIIDQVLIDCTWFEINAH